MKIDLNEIQLDALREIGNIGAGHAATALSQLLDTVVAMKVPQITLIGLKEIQDDFDNKIREIIGVHEKIYGKTKGSILLVFPSQKVYPLIDLALKREPDTTDALGFLETSTILEISHIMVGAFLTALSQLTGISFLCSVPHILKEIHLDFQYLIKEFEKTADSALLIQSELSSSSANISSTLILLFEPETLSIILEGLGLES